MQYSEERKEAVLKKMMPPHSRSIPELAREEGISEATLYNWRSQARQEGRLLPDSDTSPEGWSSRDKFSAVLETATLSEAEVGEPFDKLRTSIAVSEVYIRSKSKHGDRLANKPTTGDKANPSTGSGQEAALTGNPTCGP